ncbi:MAG: sulfite exporter TauE/SafE family protein [Anaerolineae bacterium]
MGLGIEWTKTALSALVIGVATIVHGIAGFGLAQVAMGLMPLFRSPESASVIFSMVAVISNLRVWWSVREDFDWKAWIIPVAGLAVGMPLGIYVFSALDEQALRVAIGITLLIAVALIAAVRQSSVVKDWLAAREFEPDWKIGVVAGFLAGALGGAVAIPGPPMILYGAFMVAADYWESKKMKAIFTAFFGTLMLYRVGSLAVTGAVTPSLLVEAAAAVPALFLGAWLGIKIYDAIPERIFSWVVLAMLSINAVILLTSALGG